MVVVVVVAVAVAAVRLEVILVHDVAFVFLTAAATKATNQKPTVTATKWYRLSWS